MESGISEGYKEWAISSAYSINGGGRSYSVEKGRNSCHCEEPCDEANPNDKTRHYGNHRKTRSPREGFAFCYANPHSPRLQRDKDFEGQVALLAMTVSKEKF